MGSSIQNFSENEHLIIFTAFIYGHVINTFFRGWGRWIQNRKLIILSVDHLLFSVLIFLLIIDIWWVGYFRLTMITKSLGLYFLSLLTPINLYILTTTIFPRAKLSGLFSLEEYFIRKQNLMFSLLALNFSLNIVETPLLERGMDSVTEGYFRWSAFALCIMALVIRKKWFTRVLMMIGFIVLAMHIVSAPMPHSEPLQAVFSFTSYLTIFTAFVYGCVASIFLDGFSRLIQHFRQLSFSRDHFAWSVFAFCLLLDIWYGSWERQSFVSTNLGYYILSLLTPLSFYLLAAALFPIMKENLADLTVYFNGNIKLILSLFGLVLLVNFSVANLMEEMSVFSIENLFRLTGLIMVGISIRTNNKKMHRAVLIAACSLLMVHSIYFS